MFKTASMIFFSMLLVQGCTSASVKQQKAAGVTSTPSGAVVYADSLKLGKTPLHYKPYEAFPGGWRNAVYQAQGVLMVKMEGCEDFTLRVNDAILRKPIHAELKCEQTNETAKAASAAVATEHKVENNTETRLKELEALHKKGTITKDEYAATRKRILDEL